MLHICEGVQLNRMKISDWTETFRTFFEHRSFIVGARVPRVRFLIWVNNLSRVYDS